ncbi:MAG TPA: LPS export ABC transporter permease LptF [Aliidongia sp.]|uniref:LPS export ABC transporter permease LptF n=1 Tax=Aliidongia sp. TaxID=1914230 RepID=UPI002DDD1066|nr:LPS export ABC transporter permease LptF [Aliidongia sp.]HEV2675926.1 LPS export ABC transporter permease LptF [Aliidongia sp.]
MNRLTRYIFRQCAGATLFVTLGLTSASWLIQSLKLVDLVVNRGVGIGLFVELAVLSLPQMLALTLPIGCFVGVLFSYNKMVSDSELVVMRACGLSQNGLARPALILGGLGVAAMLTMSVYFLPASKNAFKDLEFQIHNQIASVLLQEGTFNTVSDTLTIYVRARDTAGRLEGLLIQDSRDKSKPITLTAEQGLIVQVDNTPRVLMINGTRQAWDADKQQQEVLTFDRYSLDLNQFRDAPGARMLQAEERFIPDLFFPTDADNDPVLRAHLLVEGNNRFLGPLYCMTFILVALAALLTGELNRRGQTKRVLVAFAIVAGLEAMSISFTNLANRNPAVIPLMYLNVLLPAAIGLGLVLYSHRILRRRAPSGSASEAAA